MNSSYQGIGSLILVVSLVTAYALWEITRRRLANVDRTASRRYFASDISLCATVAGVTVGLAFTALVLTTERVFAGAHGRIVLLIIALFLVAPALIATAMAHVAGYVIYRAGNLPEGPKRVSYVIMAVGGAASLVYFYATYRGYRLDSRDYATILVRAWTSWLAGVAAIAMVGTAARWVLDGYRMQRD